MWKWLKRKAPVPTHSTFVYHGKHVYTAVTWAVHDPTGWPGIDASGKVILCRQSCWKAHDSFPVHKVVVVVDHE